MHNFRSECCHFQAPSSKPMYKSSSWRVAQKKQESNEIKACRRLGDTHLNATILLATHVSHAK